MENDAAILAERVLPYGSAQLVEWNWPEPLDMVVRESHHMIEMSLPPFATDGVAAFPALDPSRFRFMGNLFLRPAGVTLHARSIGGRIRVVRLAIDPDAGAHARPLALEGDRLGDGLDLRCGAPRMLLGRIRDELIAPGAESDALLRAYADALLIEIGRAIAARRARSRAAGRLADWQHARVSARIAAALPPASLEELAGLCGISVRHFTRLYRALVGESPIRTVERSRMQHAMALLGGEDMSVKAVAAATGYAHDSAFSAAFRRVAGMTPTCWQQQFRAANKPH